MTIVFKFKNKTVELTPFEIYRSQYSNMLQSYLESLFDSKITNLQEFEVIYDKASRLANRDSVKLLCNNKAIDMFKQYMEDLSSMDALYNIEDLTIDIEEQQSNKFEVTILQKQYDYVVDNFTIYAPNYKTAMDRAKTLLRHRTPMELQ